jgi:hypothetical protein
VIAYLWRDGWVGRTTLGLVVLCVAAVPLMVWLGLREAEQWKAFAAAHECKVVGRMSGDVLTGFGGSAGGQAVVTTSTTPSKTGYLCNDGVTYWR